MKLENEKALIRTIAEGNTKSFEVLFYSYYPRLKGFICDLLQSPEEAEDISQDIFTTLWQNRTSLDKIDNIIPHRQECRISAHRTKHAIQKLSAKTNRIYSKCN